MTTTLFWMLLLIPKFFSCFLIVELNTLNAVNIFSIMNIKAFPPTTVQHASSFFANNKLSRRTMTLQQTISFSLSVELSKRQRHNCGKLGHWARECKASDTRKNMDHTNKFSSTNNNNKVNVKSNDKSKNKKPSLMCKMEMDLI